MSLLGNNGGSDPLQQLSGSTTSDFRTRRLPLIHQVAFIRTGEVARNNAAPDPNPVDGTVQRYIVRLRQEWTFLGYTLGELSEVKSLDPGSIINQTTEETIENIQKVSTSIEKFVSQLQETTTSSLTSLASIENVINVSTRTSTFAIGGFIGGIIGSFAGGIGAGYGRVSASVNARTNTDTSLQVNAALRIAKNQVNETIQQLFSSIRNIKNAVTSAVNQVSPLLSRVTNLLRWVMYENYAVSNKIEGVLEIQAIPITENIYQPDPSGPPGSVLPLFTAEDIVENRRIFQRGLLEPRLAKEFDVLRRAIEFELAMGNNLELIEVEANYSALGAGADLEVTILGVTATIPLLPRASRGRNFIRLATAVAPNALGTISLRLVLRNDTAPINPLFPFPFERFRVQVTNVSLKFGGSESSLPPQSINLGNELVVGNAAGLQQAQETTEQIIVPQADFDKELNPLFRHVNQNQSHYIGLLFEAALTNPSLRDDVKIIRESFPGNHAFWSLPIVGFEGHRALILFSPLAGDLNVAKFIKDAGSGTIIQLAAPGNYAEALQGLLQLADAAGLVHPSLRQAANAVPNNGNAINVFNDLGDLMSNIQPGVLPGAGGAGGSGGILPGGTGSGVTGTSGVPGVSGATGVTGGTGIPVVP